MDSDSWSRLAAASKRHQSLLQSRYNNHSPTDLYLGFDDIDTPDDDPRPDFPCPFCSHDFDIVSLCCHIDDDHAADSNNNGVCPVCMTRVGMDMVGHITMQHASFFKMQRRRRFRRGSPGPQSTLSLLRKELRDGNLQSLFGGSSYTAAPPSAAAAADPFLSSFIYTLPVVDSGKGAQPVSVGDGSHLTKGSEKVVESVVPVLSDQDQKERAQRSEFVRELLMSTIFEDTL